MRENKKLVKSKIMIAVVMLSLLFTMFTVSITLASAQAEVSYCCERTNDGAFCQDADQSECDPGFRSTPTSCESTSFCQKGTCYDSDEGLCMENVPEEACKQANGLWSEGLPSEIPQCQLGCCLIGQEASFTTLQRCKKITADFGLITDWRADVVDEVACIELATSQDLGACVFESDFVTTCTFGTRGECDSASLPGLTNADSVTFYKDQLCTNPDFGTDCQPTTQTTCLEGKGEVYYIDSCGNPANIYDSSKSDDTDYWREIVPREEACNPGNGNANSRTCGNCAYLEGGFCGEADDVKPQFGDFICQDVNCIDTSNGKDYKNGESWCYWDSGKEDSDAPGSRHFRHICFMGEEIVEPCADYRQEVCVEDDISGFSQAGCVVNRWQDCVLQNTSFDCLNTDQRDCQWIPVLPNELDEDDLISSGGFGSINSQSGLLGGIIQREIQEFQEENNDNFRCVPTVASGLQFWDETSNSQCNLGSQSCLVKYEKGLFGDEECVENCDCLEEQTIAQFNLMCTNYGDCGADRNYVGVYTSDGIDLSSEKGDKDSLINSQRQAAAPGGSDTFGGPSGESAGEPTPQQTFSGPGGNEFPSANQPAPAGLGMGIISRIKYVGGWKSL